MNNFEGDIQRIYWTTEELSNMLNVSHSTICSWNYAFEVGARRGLYTKDMVAKMHIIHNLRRIELYSIAGVKLKLQTIQK